ncbi:12035_t:CDS:2, partial [Gigaspora rosea]
QSTSKATNDVSKTVNTNDVPSTVNTNAPTTVNTKAPAAVSTNGPATDELLRVELTYRQIDTRLCYALAMVKYTARLLQLGIDNVVGTVGNTVGTVGNTVGNTVSSLGKTLGLSKRASNQYLGAINYANDVEWISQISMGTPPQSFLVVLDTASSDLWIPCIDCSDCSNKRLFDYTESSTIQYDNSDFSITYADGSRSRGWEEL